MNWNDNMNTINNKLECIIFGISYYLDIEFRIRYHFNGFLNEYLHVGSMSLIKSKLGFWNYDWLEEIS